MRDVPKVRKRRVSALRDGVSVMDGDSIAGTGYKEYADVVVSTIRNESRGFERARRVEKRRFMEFFAAASDWVVRIEAASSCVRTGSEESDTLASAASFFSRWRLRCGSSSGIVAVRGTGTGSSFGIDGILAVKDVDVLALPFETTSFLGRNVLFRKYPVRNCCAAFRTFVLDDLRVAKCRDCGRAMPPKHGSSTPAKALCFATPSEGRRMIIAASGCEVASLQDILETSSWVAAAG